MRQLIEREVNEMVESAYEEIPDSVSGNNKRKAKGILCGYIMSANFSQPKLDKQTIKNTCMTACFVYNRFSKERDGYDAVYVPLQRVFENWPQ